MAEHLEPTRCDWARNSEIEARYHDQEWGRPVYNSKELFRHLMLDGMQAGLSWHIILRKREELLRAFDGFDPDIVRHYDEEKVQELLANPGIVRNGRKVRAVISNAGAYFRAEEQAGSFSDFLWRYVDHKPLVNHWTESAQIPTSTPLSDRVSKDLKGLGFQFAGSTIVYAFMQAVGIIDDHLESCFIRQAGKKAE